MVKQSTAWYPGRGSRGTVAEASVFSLVTELDEILITDQAEALTTSDQVTSELVTTAWDPATKTKDAWRSKDGRTTHAERSSSVRNLEDGVTARLLENGTARELEDNLSTGLAKTAWEAA